MIQVESFTRDSMIITIRSEHDLRDFRELVQRGANCWSDASPRIKEAADLITNGKVLQDYGSQNVDLNKKRAARQELEKVLTENARIFPSPPETGTTPEA